MAHAVEFCRDTGVRKVILEGDSKQVVRALEEKEQSSCTYGQVLDDAKIVLKGFIGWEVCHIKRELNMAAHRLAKEASKKFSEKVWLEETPNSIIDLINLERLALAL
jgi:ribonuclease HI